MIRRLVPAIALAAVSVASTSPAYADPYGVGLGVAAGVNLADADVDNIDMETSFSWGFFVDIPLIETFYITPAATLYQLPATATADDGTTISTDDRISITDIDLNFKFIIPLGALSLGVGVTAGLTTGLGDYQPHYGALAYIGYNLIANLDLFAMGQYKRLATGDDIPDYNNIHIFGGTMFRF